MNIYVFSGPCGCGKSTLTNRYARHLVQHTDRNQVYVIHGDDFHRGFAETDRRVGPACPGFQYWADILSFNWECIVDVAQKALNRGLDVLIDYVVEDELPLLTDLARRNNAQLFFVILTAAEDELRQRLTGRGDPELIDRSLFLKSKLESTPEFLPYLYDISGMSVEEEIRVLDPEKHAVPLH